MKPVRLSSASNVNSLAPASRGDFVSRLRATPLAALEAALNSLTGQERVVLDLLVRGDYNKDICKSLSIEITTAKAHISRIFKKLGVKNRVQAAVFGLWTTLLMTTADSEAAHVSLPSQSGEAAPGLTQQLTQ